METPGKIPFGRMPDGTPVEQYTLTDGAMECDIITYGGALRALRLPDRQGARTDVLLGFDTLEDYRRQDKYIGALIGRYANRIGGAGFQLNGVHYPLAANDGPNHLHGGEMGFDKQVWKVEDAGARHLALSLFSPDGQEGYPGNLEVWVTYRLERGGITIDYRARCDRDTLCSLTNHAYFNLDGHAAGPVIGQEIQVLADFYTPTDPCSIPDGTLCPVAGTPMDLRESTPIGARIDEAFPQLIFAGGYDHNWVLRGEGAVLRPAARAFSGKTGIRMEVLTTQPGLQFYAGNYLDGCPAGKGGAPYAKRWGFCLEAQHFPDSPHHPQFASTALKAGTEYRQTTVYRFEIDPIHS